jgi:hypothetical protein
MAIISHDVIPPGVDAGRGTSLPIVVEYVPPTAPGHVLEPNLAAAARFLTLLDEEAEAFTFVTFDDNSSRKDPGLTRELIGTLDQHAAELARLNRAGAGVFVTVNATDGRGRKRENVTRVRAFWQEADQGDEPPLPIEPHIDVESSRGRHHRYFLVEGVPLDEFDAIQRCLVERYGSDRSAADLSRVLRLPGFYHQKVKPARGRTGEPFMARIVHESGAQPLPRERVLAIFPPVAEVASALQATTTEPVVIGSDTQRELRSALASLRADDRKIWVDMGMALNELGDVGRALWFEWAQTSEKYDPADASRVWESLRPTRTGYKAVFAEAQRYGWLNPLSAGAGSSVALPPSAAAAPIVRRGFELVHVADLLGNDVPHNWLIKGLIELDSLGQVFGDPASGKSLLAQDWSACIAAGVDWCGRAVAQGAVVYIAGEGHHGIKRRLQAWARHHDVDLSEAPLYVSKTPADLVAADGLQAVLEALAAHPDPLLVVIDTLARNLGAADENSSQDIGQFIAHLDLIRAQTHATILVVHHAGHEAKDRGRGSSALRAAWDFEYRLARNESRSVLTSTKAKDFEPAAPMHFEIEAVALDYTDEDGQPVTSAVLVPSETERRNAERRKSTLTNAQKIALQALHDVVAKYGQSPPRSVTDNVRLPFGCRIVEVERWRKHAYAMGISDGETEAKRKAFQRAREGLQAREKAGVWEDWAWTDDPDWVRGAVDDAAEVALASSRSEEGPVQGQTGTSPDICPGRPSPGGTGQDTGLEACPVCPGGRDACDRQDAHNEYERMH